MNEHNLDAINDLFELPSGPNGVNENFYWAVHGNWPDIAKILAKHFATPEENALALLKDYYAAHPFGRLGDRARELLGIQPQKMPEKK